MPLIQDTAYPRLTASPGMAELAGFTPTAAEMAFVGGRTRRAGPRLALLVLLKTYQHLGYFVALGQVPPAIRDHLATVADLCEVLDTLPDYDSSTYRVRLTAAVRGFVGVSNDGPTIRRTAVRASVAAARARDEAASKRIHPRRRLMGSQGGRRGVSLRRVP